MSAAVRVGLAVCLTWALSEAASAQTNPTNSCAGYFECAWKCDPSDEACMNGCIPTDSVEYGKLAVLGSCLNSKCSGVPEAEFDACAEAKCAPSLEACFSDPAPSIVSCGDFFTCAKGCAPNDQACVNACAPSDPTELQELQLLIDCLNASCGETMSDAEFQACAEQHCTPEINTCFATGGPVGPSPCPPGLTYEGCCAGTVLHYCENGKWNTGECGANGCGWQPAGNFYDCGGSGEDPSGASPLTCGAFIDPAETCGDVTYEGECNDDKAIWCEGGELVIDDCPLQGKVCTLDDNAYANCQTVSGSSCGSLTIAGKCEAKSAVWCDSGAVVVDDCASKGKVCGIDDQGYANCLEPADTCGDVPSTGACLGNVATWCLEGALVETDCSSSGAVCTIGANGSASCADAVPGCGEVTELGACDGAVLVYCDGGEVVQVDCSAQGATCEVDDLGLAVCAEADACGDVTEAGACQDGVAVRCEAGAVQTDDCAARGEECQLVNGVAACSVAIAGCGAVSELGECQGGVAVRCVEGQLVKKDCAAVGTICGLNGVGAATCAAPGAGGSDAGGSADSGPGDQDAGPQDPGTPGDGDGGPSGGADGDVSGGGAGEAPLDGVAPGASSGGCGAADGPAGASAPLLLFLALVLAGARRRVSLGP